MHKKFRFTLLALSLIAFALLAACEKKEAVSVVKAAPEKVLRFVDNAEVASLNAQIDTNTVIWYSIYYYTHSGLYIRVPTEDGRGAVLIGDIADGDPYLADNTGRVWRINLKRNAKWHNGAPINADTFVYSYKMFIDPLLLNNMANFFYDREIKIVNAYEYYIQAQEGRPAIRWEDVGFKKIDDYTVEISTTQRYNAEDVKRHFTDRSVMPVYEPYYEAGMNSTRTQTSYGTTLDNYMGCGPYYFDSWNYGTERIYVKNPDHWHSNLFHFDRVEVRISGDRNTRVMMFENGDIDMLTLDATTMPQYRDDPRIKQYITLSPHHIDINNLNTNNPILRTQSFRNAMYWAMDRQTIGDLVNCIPAAYYVTEQAGVFNGLGTNYRSSPEARAVVPPNMGYDPNRARQYFDAALAEIGQNSVTLELIYSEAQEGHRIIGEFLQQALPEIFGRDRFSLTLRSVPDAAYEPTATNWRINPNICELAFGGWGASLSRVYPHAAFMYFMESYGSRPNSYVSRELERLYAIAQTEDARINPQYLIELTAQMETVFLSDVVNVPLYQTVAYIVYSEKLILPCKEYIPYLDYGALYADIKVD